MAESTPKQEDSVADESPNSSARQGAGLEGEISLTIEGDQSGGREVAPKKSYADLEQRNAYLEEGMAEIRAKHESLVAKLTHEVQRLNGELLNVRMQYRQQVEEFERAKLRIENEFTRQTARHTEKLLIPFLGVVDDLERATEASERSKRDPSILSGVRLIWGNLLRTLLGFDVRALDALGMKFDASLHEAVATAYVDDPARAGTVVEVVQTGYLIGDQLLRPAKVVVGKAAEGIE